LAGYLDELDQAFLTIDTGQGALDFQLVGTALLNPHRLEIDYGKRTVDLISNPDW
jgi:hypothetical protein